jgi:hypothetical protein
VPGVAKASSFGKNDRTGFAPPNALWTLAKIKYPAQMFAYVDSTYREFRADLPPAYRHNLQFNALCYDFHVESNRVFDTARLNPTSP